MSPANIHPPISWGPKAFGITFLLFIFWGGLGFFLCLWMSRSRVESVSKICLAHLDYVLQTKDDMGLVDWAHALEKTEDGLAYDVHLMGRSKISGGNQSCLPENFSPGLSFQFPSQWRVGWQSPSRGVSSLLVFEALPSPWMGGLVLGLLTSLGYLGTFSYFQKKLMSIPSSLPSRPRNEAAQGGEQTKLASVSITGKLPTNHPYLLVSPDLEILDSSPSIQTIFPFFHPASSIFFDLQPLKSLSDLIQKGGEGRMEGAFGSVPGLGVRVRHTGEGSLLVFSPPQEDGGPKTIEFVDFKGLKQ